MASLGTAKVDIEVEIDESKLNSSFSKLASMTNQQANKIKGILSGAIGTSFLSNALKGEGDFERSLRQVSAIAENVDLNSLRKQAEQLSETFGGEATDAVNGFYQAISAGFQDQKSATNIMKWGQNLASIGGKGGFASTEESVNLLTTALNAYGLDASYAEKVTNTLFKTITYGKTTAAELANSFSTAASISSVMGVKMEDLMQVVAVLTQKGFDTASAMVAVRQMINEMADSGRDAGKAISENLGMSFAEAMNSGMSLADVLANGVLPAVQGNNQELINIFGNIRSASGAAALASGDFDKLKQVQAGFKNETTTASAAVRKMATSDITTWDGTLKRVKNTLMDIINSVGGVRNAVIILGSVFAAFKLGNFVAQIAKAIAALSALAVAKAASQTGVGAVAAIPAVVAAIGAGIAAVGAIAGIGMLASGGSGGGSGSSEAPQVAAIPQVSGGHVNIQINNQYDPTNGQITSAVRNSQTSNSQTKF